jgi:hypothetical protein
VREPRGPRARSGTSGVAMSDLRCAHERSGVHRGRVAARSPRPGAACGGRPADARRLPRRRHATSRRVRSCASRRCRHGRPRRWWPAAVSHSTPTASLLGGVRLPTVEQSRVLLRHGPRRDVLELAHHHRQDRGQGTPAGRVHVPRAAAAHRRRHLTDGDRPPRQGAAQGARLSTRAASTAPSRKCRAPTTRCGSLPATWPSAKARTPMSTRPRTSPARRPAPLDARGRRRRSRACCRC